MSQESEVTKWTEEQLDAARRLEGLVCYGSPDRPGKRTRGETCAEIARIAHLFASAPPADARLREAQRAGLDAALLDAWHDAAIEECAQIVEHVASNLPLGFGTASGGVVAQEAAKRIRALRSSPAPSLDNCGACDHNHVGGGGCGCPCHGAPRRSPSKGARETPALDGLLEDLEDSYDASTDGDGETFRATAHVRNPDLAACRRELSALKSTAPERPAMAVEAAEKLIDVCAWRIQSVTRATTEDITAIKANLRDLVQHFTPAAASPTVKMPERSDLAHLIGTKWPSRLDMADAVLAEFARLNAPPVSPQDGKEQRE